MLIFYFAAENEKKKCTRCLVWHRFQFSSASNVNNESKFSENSSYIIFLLLASCSLALSMASWYLFMQQLYINTFNDNRKQPALSQHVSMWIGSTFQTVYSPYSDMTAVSTFRELAFWVKIEKQSHAVKCVIIN